MKIVYQTEDKCVFDTKAEAEAHEHQLGLRSGIVDLLEAALNTMSHSSAAELRNASVVDRMSKALAHMVAHQSETVASALGFYTPAVLRDEIKLALASGMAEVLGGEVDLVAHTETPDFANFADTYISTRLAGWLARNPTKEQA